MLSPRTPLNRHYGLTFRPRAASGPWSVVNLYHRSESRPAKADRGMWLCGHFPAAKAWKPRCLVIPTLTRSQSPKHSPLHTTRTRSLGPIPKTNPRYLECLSKARADPDDSDVGVLPCLTVPPLGTRWQDAYSSRDQTHHQRESTDPSCMELV